MSSLLIWTIIISFGSSTFYDTCWINKMIVNNYALHFFPDDPVIRAVTNWVVADLETESGRSLLYEAVKQMVRNRCQNTK